MNIRFSEENTDLIDKIDEVCKGHRHQEIVHAFEFLKLKIILGNKEAQTRIEGTKR